jgi:hypothetical protein
MSTSNHAKEMQKKMIEAFESAILPSNENEYQDIAKTLVNPSKIHLPDSKENRQH